MRTMVHSVLEGGVEKARERGCGTSMCAIVIIRIYILCVAIPIIPFFYRLFHVTSIYVLLNNFVFLW